MLEIASEMFEVDPADLEIVDGRVADRKFEFVAVHIGAVLNGPVDLQGIAGIANDIAKDILWRCWKIICGS